MHLSQVQVSGYRNLIAQSIELSEGVNLFVGNNGQGKTNILEAVHFLSSLRSFRAAAVRDVIAHGEDVAQLGAKVLDDGLPTELKLILGGSGRRLWLGQRSISNVREYLGQFKVVAFTPDDLAMVKAGPALRRRFLDRAVFLFSPAHLTRVRQFQTALRSRNSLLKQRKKADLAVIDSFSQKMAEYGAEVSRARCDFVRRIEPRAAAILAEMEETSPRLDLRFKAGWQAGEDLSQADLYQDLCDSLDRDLLRKQTSHGPQQDDFEISLAGESARRFASQGQQRSCVVALLLAVVELADAELGLHPVILLDDVSSELDPDRRQQLLGLVSKLGSQLLITTTDEGLVGDMAGQVNRRFRVYAGRVDPL